MFRRSIPCLAAVLAAALLTGALAMAAPTEEGSLEFGPYIGWAKWDDYGAFKPDDSALYGFRFGGFISSSLSAEASPPTTPRDGPRRTFQPELHRINALWLPARGPWCAPSIGGDYDSPSQGSHQHDGRQCERRRAMDLSLHGRPDATSYHRLIPH
jgi:hypothetical protein